MPPDVRRGLPRRGVAEMYWALPQVRALPLIWGHSPDEGQSPETKNTRTARQAVPHIRRRSQVYVLTTIFEH